MAQSLYLCEVSLLCLFLPSSTCLVRVFIKLAAHGCEGQASRLHVMAMTGIAGEASVSRTAEDMAACCMDGFSSSLEVADAGKRTPKDRACLPALRSHCPRADVQRGWEKGQPEPRQGAGCRLPLCWGISQGFPSSTNTSLHARVSWLLCTHP